MNKMTRKSNTCDIKTGKLNQACERYNLGETYMRKIAEEAGAVVKIGKSLLINFSIMDAYMDELSQ